MLADAPATRPPMPCMLHLYVDDADATYRRALDAGATSVEPPAISSMATAAPWCRIRAQFVSIATHIEDVPPDELKRRAARRCRGGR